MFAPMGLDSSNKGEECASAHSFSKDFSWAGGLIAEKFPRLRAESALVVLHRADQPVCVDSVNAIIEWLSRISWASKERV